MATKRKRVLSALVAITGRASAWNAPRTVCVDAASVPAVIRDGAYLDEPACQIRPGDLATGCGCKGGGDRIKGFGFQCDCIKELIPIIKVESEPNHA